MSEEELWAGQLGKTWARLGEAIDRQLEPAGTVGIAALAPQRGEAILDLGCGAGATTAHLSHAVGPAGHVTGVDISPDLIAVARTRSGNERAEFIVGDAQTRAFEPAAYDALFSRFGCMFFNDPAATFANLRQAMKPGGRAVLVVWREMRLNPWATMPAGVGAEMFGPADPPAPGAPGPFAWAHPEFFRPILDEAGFSGIAWTEAPLMLQVGEEGPHDPVERAATLLVHLGPLARRLRDAPNELRRAAAARLAPKLRPFVSDGWVRLPGAIWVISARA